LWLGLFSNKQEFNMMRKFFLVFAVFIVSSPIIACGIPEEELNTVQAEKDSIQQELESTQNRLQSTEIKLKSTQSELESALSEIEVTQGELEKISTELKSVKNQLSSSQSTVRSHRSNMDKASKYIQALNVFLYPVRKEAGMEQLIDFKDEAEWLITLDKIVSDTKDDAFQTIYTEWKIGQVDSSLGFARFLSQIAIMALRTLD